MTEQPTIVGTDDAAKRLKVSRATITRWAQAGKLVPIGKTSGIRGAYVFRVEDIEAKIERKAS